MKLQKNDLVELTIEGMTAEGQGVGRAGGLAVFVPLAAVGDRLLVRIVKVLKTYAFGKIETILSPADTRQPPDCPVYRQCGGCVYQHLTYAEEQRIKLQQVNDCLQRLGGLDFRIDAIRTAGEQRAYRNKAQYPLCERDGHVTAGFYAVHSHRVVPYADCLLTPPFFGDIVRAATGFLERYSVPIYREDAHTGVARHLYIRWGESTGETMVCLVVNSGRLRGRAPADGAGEPPALPSEQTERCRTDCERAFAAAIRAACPQVVSVLLCVNRERTNVVLTDRFRTLWGKDAIEDVLCGVRIRLAPGAFYQVNHAAAELLYGQAAELAGLRPDDVLLDLYCGAGAIGLSMAGRVRRVIGVEIVPAAVENARENARLNHISNAEFFCADAAEAAMRLREQEVCPTVVVLDPPRKGCDAALIETVAGMAPDRVVYVSCNPATLARDCRVFAEKGYRLTAGTAVDLFARTGHVETVVLLSKVEK